MPIAEGDAEQKLVAAAAYRCLCGAEFPPDETITGLIATVEEHVRFDCPKTPRAAAAPPAPVWPPNAEAMTLGQVEALAKRLGTAAATFNEARALLGAPVVAPAAVPAPAAPLVPGPTIGPGGLPRPPTRFNDPDAAAELQVFHQSQERARLVAQNRDDPANFPPGIANAMRGG